MAVAVAFRVTPDPAWPPFRGLTCHSMRTGPLLGKITYPDTFPTLEGVRTLAKPNYAFAKRQRDLAKKQKKEAKRLRKSETEQATSTPSAEEPPPAEKPAP
jgi:hypothetical protein